MKSLPSNVVLAIVSNLDLLDKINCMLVCKSWRQWIRNKVLYESLCFRGNSDKLRRALEFFNTSGYFLGTQVKSLYMTSCILEPRSLIMITRVLPNLTKLVWLEANQNRSRSVDKMACSMFRLYGWKHLEYICIDAITFSLFSILGIGSSLSKLTTLSIEFEGIQKKQEILKSLIFKLQYAKSLEQLVLRSAVIGFQDMENIHYNASCLKTLILDFVELLMNQSLKNTVVEADAMRFFRMNTINTGKILYDKNQKVDITHWLNYFGWKYQKISKIHLQTEFDRLSKPELSQCVAYLVSKMVHLTGYQIQLCPLTTDILQAMTNNNIKLKSAKVWFNGNDFDEQIYALESWGQIIYLESLDIIIDEQLKLGSLLALRDMIGNLSNLKELTIVNVPIKLDDVPLIIHLNRHPSLTDICVDHIEETDVIVQLKTRKGLIKNSLKINIFSYKFGNHANVSKVINSILEDQTHYFNEIQIHGEVYCGIGVLRILQTKGETLQRLELQLNGIGHFGVCKTRKGSEVWHIISNQRIAKNNSKTCVYHVDPRWTIRNMTDLYIQF